MPAGRGGLEVGPVGREHLGRPLLEHVGRGQERGILRPGRCGGEELSQQPSALRPISVTAATGMRRSVILDRPVKFSEFRRERGPQRTGQLRPSLSDLPWAQPDPVSTAEQRGSVQALPPFRQVRPRTV